MPELLTCAGTFGSVPRNRAALSAIGDSLKGQREQPPAFATSPNTTAPQLAKYGNARPILAKHRTQFSEAGPGNNSCARDARSRGSAPNTRENSLYTACSFDFRLI